MDTSAMHTSPHVSTIHRLCGVTLAAFVAIHLVNHALLAVDRDMAFAFMDMFRIVYRWVPVEALILAGALVQSVTGRMLARRRTADGRGKNTLARITGWYLLFFLVVHVSAVLGARAMGIDTGMHFAAAGLKSWPSRAFFVPYYFLAVVAVAVHIGLAVSRTRAGRAPGGARSILAWSTVAGAVTAGVIVGSLIGLE
jgi:succinate dehydrogenase/fumarate reductase cytochrome b subunit